MRHNGIDFNNNFILCYLKYSEAITKFLKRMVFNADISEELAQDLFLKIYERAQQLDPDSFRTRNYLLTAAKNIAIDYLKRRSVEEAKYKEVHFEEVSLNKQFYNDIENSYLDGEIISTMHDAINSFPEKKRDIFIEKVFNSRNRTAISRDCNVSTYMIKKIEQEIHGKIKHNLIEYIDDDYEET